MEGVSRKGLELQLRPKAAVVSGYTRFQTGDVLVPKIAPTFSHGRSVVVPELPGGCGTGTTELHVLRPRDGVSPAWLCYVSLSSPFITGGEATYYGVAGQKRISLDWLKSFHVPVVPLDRQMRVVALLDDECGKIDGLLAEQSRLLTLLTERRSAVVFSEVTGAGRAGERVPGLPWARTLPSEWRQVRVRQVATQGSGHTPSRLRPELWRDCHIPWITTGEVAQIRSDVVEVLTETRECISDLGIQESSAVVRPAGTVVLCRTAASAGYSAIMGRDMATSQDFATWTCGPELLPQYLLYCLRAMRADLLGRLAQGSTHKTIYMPDIHSIAIPLPTVAEQREICVRLRQSLDAVDLLQEQVGVQLNLLKERRQAVITAAVTGELEVA